MALRNVGYFLRLAFFRSSRVSVKGGPDTCGWRMRIEKWGWKKNADNKKSERKKNKKCGWQKKKKQNKHLRKEIFLSSPCHMVGPFTYIQNVMPIVGAVLYPVIPFINVTEMRTLRSSSLNAHILSALLL